MYEVLYAARYGKNHPYGWPTIGWMEDIEAITLEDCHAFYETFYAQRVGCGCGAMESREVFRLAEEHYGIAFFSLPEETGDAQWTGGNGQMALPLSSERLL